MHVQVFFPFKNLAQSSGIIRRIFSCCSTFSFLCSALLTIVKSLLYFSSHHIIYCLSYDSWLPICYLQKTIFLVYSKRPGKPGITISILNISLLDSFLIHLKTLRATVKHFKTKLYIFVYRNQIYFSW